MVSKDLVPVTFRLTSEERAKFRIYCLSQKPPTSMQQVLEAFVRSKIGKHPK